MVGSTDAIPLSILLPLQLRTFEEPFLPRLKRFKCDRATANFFPFFPLFLSPETTEIEILFKSTPDIVVAPVINSIPTLCPALDHITLRGLDLSHVLTDAVSGLLLACNPDTLRAFFVDSPLTEEALQVACQLPNVSELCMVFEGHTQLPPVSLPNLISLFIEYYDSLDWLQVFHGVTLEKLESVCFSRKTQQVGNFLEEFETLITLTTSAQNTLSEIRFLTWRAWHPNYSSLLPFKQLKVLEIQFSCATRCSSMVDDDVTTALAEAMPKLEILRLGNTPCKTATGSTVDGLIGLASRCPHLSILRIHFKAATLYNAVRRAVKSPPGDKLVVQREGCDLKVLEVGDIPIPAHSKPEIAFTLLQIFPHIREVQSTNEEWRAIAGTIMNFRLIGTFVRHAGKDDYFQLPFDSSDTPPGGLD